jgi:hypothetical protein
VLFLAAGCDDTIFSNGDVAEDGPRGDEPEPEPASPALRRLGRDQYAHAVADLFGAGIRAPTSLEPDSAIGGLRGIGGAVLAVSSRGIEQYEAAAFDVAGQVVATAASRDAAFPSCAGSVAMDVACLRADLPDLVLRAWRRPPSDDEIERLAWVGAQAGATLGGQVEAERYVLAALLQAPSFLYRVELGADAADGPRRYTGFEMATRLSFLAWDAIPDGVLLAAAEAGELDTEAGIAAQFDRLVADPRAEDGVRAFFTDMLRLYELDALTKDTTLFLHMDETVGPAAAEETLLGIEALVFHADADVRDFLTTRTSYVDRKLAAIYGVAAPAREGFGRVEYPVEGPRRGFLGQASFLALQAHSTSTSVTRRGLFVREVLLCQELPDPPANVDTSIPEVSPETPTMRDRVAIHLEEPTCAACHRQTDPIGLAMEHFDGLGGYRATDAGYAIDPSGDLDGAAFSDAVGLADALHDHPSLGPCLARTAFSYAHGHEPSGGEIASLQWHADGFEAQGYRWLDLLRDIATSEAFRTAGALD